MGVLGSPEFKVGAMVVIVSTLVGYMSLKLSEGPGLFSGNKRYWFEIENAGGVVKNSAVKMAGIRTGVIDEIELVNGRARLHLLIDGDVVLTKSAKVELKADGILGDRHVELIAGNPADPKLKDGDQITEAIDIGALDKVVSEIGRISGSLSELAGTLNKATQGKGDAASPVGRIILNLENLTKDFSDISSANKQKINEIVDNVHKVSEDIKGLMSEEGAEGFKAAWQKAVASLSRIDSSLRNLDEITSKINRGEGTIGRLVNDEETIDKINEAVENVNDFLGGTSKMETSVDFHSEYLTDPSLTKSFLTLKIQPGLDRHYELGVVDDPKGVMESTLTRTSTNGGADTETDETKTFRNKVKFTAIFAKNFYDFSIKGGIIESAGGVGFDYYLMKRRLRFSVEAFNFRDTYVRAFARYNVLRGIYLIGGGDNVFDNSESSAFVGGGIFVTNDDLKVLASKVAF